MSSRSTERPAWGPWTFKGVARFAHAPLRRLLALEAVVAVIVAACVTLFVVAAWLPALDQAADALPDSAVITRGRLEWPGVLPQPLTESRFLGIVVVGPGGGVGQTADVQIELAPARWRVRSLLGYLEFPYPEGWRVELARKEAGPWWGARRPFAAVTACAGALVLMPLSWALLGLLYAPVAKLLALAGGRELSVSGAWKLASAALMPGALMLGAVIVLYGFQRLPLAAVMAGWAAHLIVGWIYLLVAPFRLPKHSQGGEPRGNPFGGEGGKADRKKSGGNPFRG